MNWKFWTKKQAEPQNIPVKKRNFAAARIDRLTLDFVGNYQSANQDLRYDLPVLRARSRQICNDDPYARKFLQMVKSNVVGSSGFTMQSRARRSDGSVDKLDSDLIETVFTRWTKKQNASISQVLSWIDLQRLFIETVARDGEVLVRIIRGADNEFAFALQLLESDYLDITLNREKTRYQNEIKMGIELDEWDRPLFYHLNTSHPGDKVIQISGRNYLRLPASEMLHCFITERPGQVRGIPWLNTSIKSLNQLGKYIEAELVASRLGASKMGFFTSPDGDGYTGEEDNDGNLMMEASPGSFEQLPAGMSLQTFDPQHPSTAFESFNKRILRGASAGLGVAYNAFANDLEGVNFSSIRTGVLEERDSWRCLQKWMCQSFCTPIFEKWLPMAITSGQLNLPMSNLKKFLAHEFVGRGWSWVDPLKDIKSNQEGINLGIQTRQEVAASQGKELEDIFEQLAREKALAKQYGINITGEKDNGQDTED